MNNQFFLPAIPHHPVNDQFGSPVFSFGLSKIELATLIIAAGNINHNAEPETIADMAFEIAEKVLDKCDQALKDATKGNGSALIAHK